VLYGDFARIVYLPYDYAWLTRRFVRRLQPRVGILMETELWPNLIRAAARRACRWCWRMRVCRSALRAAMRACLRLPARAWRAFTMWRRRARPMLRG